jgi:hypothetical protein
MYILDKHGVTLINNENDVGTLFFSANIDNYIQQEMNELKSEIIIKNNIIDKL